MEERLKTSAKIAAILLLPAVLAACAGSDEGRGISFTDDRGVSNQPFPNNYRSEIVSFMRTYLNNPVGVRFTARDSGGNYVEPLERAIQFVDGRLDRIVENASEPCAGAAYAPFPELEKMTR